MPRDSLSEQARNRFVKALLSAEKGDYWGAIEGYRTIRPSDPSSRAAVHHAAARAFFDLGVVDSARHHADQAVMNQPDNRHYLRMQAAIAHHIKDYSGAVSAFSRLVALQPANTEFLTLLALEYIASGDAEKALEIFQRMLSLDPADEQTRAQVLLLEIKLRHYHDAIETLSALIEEGEEKERLKLTLGELYMQTGQTERAVKTYREIIAANPRFVPAWLALLEISVQSGAKETFLGDLTAFYDTIGMKFEQKMSLAELFYVRSSKDSTYQNPLRIMIAEIERRHPGEPSTMLMRGRLLLREKKSADAKKEFRAVLRKDPSSIEAWEELVSALLAENNYAEAMRAVVSAKSNASASQMRLLVLEGFAAFQTGRTEIAVTHLEKALRLKQPEKERWLYLQAASTLAMSYDKLGQTEKSIDMYRRILFLEPGNTLAMNNLAYMLAIEGRDLETAKTLATKAVAEEPDNPVYLDTLGWVLFRLGAWQEALVHLEKAASLAPHEVEIIGHLIDVYEKLGMQDKAGKLREMIKAAG
ncbi:tetratricopeptide repeat protein [Chlorobium limicola]